MAKITIYTSNTCAYCDAAKDFMQSKSLSYDEVNVDLQPEKRQEAFELSGQMSVPVILVERDDGMKSVNVGFKPAELAATLGV